MSWLVAYLVGGLGWVALAMLLSSLTEDAEDRAKTARFLVTTYIVWPLVAVVFSALMAGAFLTRQK